MADEQEKGKPEEEGADTTDWKAMARKWEARSKENAVKAKAYDELQEFDPGLRTDRHSTLAAAWAFAEIGFPQVNQSADNPRNANGGMPSFENAPSYGNNGKSHHFSR